jgi:TolB-like protein/DNA-binding winged helix-turn-helix (wHTH) protein
METGDVLQFGPFRADMRRRVLLRGDEVVALPAKAFDVLQVLLQTPGEMVTKEQLLSAVWPDTNVEEGNLTQMVFLLRKALGDSGNGQYCIVTVPRRGYRFIGELKNTPPANPSRRRGWMPAVAMGIMALCTASIWRLGPRHAQAISTIAVLPFQDISRQKDLDYFCEGVTDEMITALSQIRGLRVTARGSAFQFKHKNEDVRTIGSKLGVEAVLAGTVLRDGARLRLTAELVSTKTGHRLWAEAYDHNAGDVFAAERAISRSVAEALHRRAGDDTYVPLRYTNDPVTYDLYLKGRSALLKRPLQAVAYFDQALQRNRSYAPAYAGLADAYTRMWKSGINPKQTLPKAREAAEAGLKLDDGLAEAHYAKANLLARDWDWRGALAETERALHFAPSLGKALWFRGNLLLITGREQEAPSVYEKAEAIDPMAPNLFETKIASLLGMKRFDEMITFAKQYPEASGSAYWLGRAYAEKRMMQEALAQLELDRTRGGQGYGLLAMAYVHAGRRSEALKLLDEMEKTAERQYIKPSTLATAYFAVGDLERGFRWLDRAVEEHDPVICWLKLDMGFAPGRDDPRFKALLKKVHLDQ